jgi:putative FmdB family regulatory protein
MPLYEYRCEHCGLIFEVLTKRKKRGPKCPCCKGNARKLNSGNVAVKYNGSGFTKQVKGERDE